MLVVKLGNLSINATEDNSITSSWINPQLFDRIVGLFESKPSLLFFLALIKAKAKLKTTEDIWKPSYHGDVPVVSI